MNTHDSNTPIDTPWNEFKTLCNQCLNMIPQKCVTTKACPSWLTGKIKRLSRRKQRKYNKACLTNNPDDWAGYHKLKKDMQRLCRTSRNNYVHHCWIPITNVQKSFGDISKVCVKNKSPLTLYYLMVKPTLTVQQKPIY